MHIYRRNRIYHYRIRIPENIRSHFQKSEIHKSLKTANRTTAIKYAKILQAHYEFIKKGILLHKISDAEIKDAVSRFVHLKFESFDKHYYSEFEGIDRLYNSLFETHDDEEYEEYEEYVQRGQKALHRDLSLLSKDISSYDSEIKQTATEILNNLDKSYSDDDMYHLQALLKDGFKQALKAVLIKLEQGEYRAKSPYIEDFISTLLQPASVNIPEQPKPIAIQTTEETLPVQDSTPLMSVEEACNSYLDSIKPIKSEETYNAHKYALTMLPQYFGSKTAIKHITTAKLYEFRTALYKTPTNITQKNYYNKLESLESIIDKAAILKDQLLSPTSIYKNIGFYGAFFKHCKICNYVEENPYTPELRPPKPTSTKKKKRDAYSEDDLIKMFETPFYQEKLHTTLKKRPEKLFIPIIALYSGMRMNEICQLYKEDIKKVDGIWCFDINEERDKVLKNDSSERLIPIHNKIIKSGFLNYVQSVTTPRIWNSLKKHEIEENIDDENDEAKGRYSKQFSKWFRTQVNRKHVTKDSKKVFHSLRHNNIKKLIHSNVKGEHIASLVGHTQELGMTFEVYGDPIPPFILQPELNQIHFEIEAIERAIDNIANAVKEIYPVKD